MCHHKLVLVFDTITNETRHVCSLCEHVDVYASDSVPTIENSEALALENAQ